MDSSSTKTVSDTKAFWNTEACGTHFIDEQTQSREFYERYRQFRYETEWHIPLLVPFAEGKNKSVLEIGCGNGADGVMWAQHGANYTGVDLTEAAVQATRKHFETLGLHGAFQTENAEALSFADNTFDIVYSHGVLHHTPNTAQTIREVHRVLKPGGKAVIMLYYKSSFNYHVRIMGYMRLRTLLKMGTRLGQWNKDRQVAALKSLRGLRGNEDNSIWQIHYENFLREGWTYLNPKNFVHHCTDGPECPFAFAFNQKEAKQIFSMFKEVKMKVAHFPLRKYSRLVPLSIEKAIASRVGWYLFIYAEKQPA
jgi:ubiquinone/menaquinone biosynthesis C-methylase UbiE